MKRYFFVSFFLLFLSIVFFVISILNGEIQGGFFFFIPFFIGSGVFSSFAFFTFFLFIVVQFFLYPLYQGLRNEKTDNNHINLKSLDESENNKKTSKISGVIFLGPFPIVFSNQKKMILPLAIFGIIFLIVYFILYFLIKLM